VDGYEYEYEYENENECEYQGGEYEYEIRAYTLRATPTIVRAKRVDRGRPARPA
jgi:hypothetical protein